MMDVVYDCVGLRLAIDNYTVCGYGGVKCMSEKGNYSTLLNKDLVTDDYQVIPKGNQEGEIIRSLREIGFLKKTEGRGEFQRYFSRLMYNPSRELLEVIRKERRRIGLAKNQLGAHIRCAGNLANRREGVAMITPELLATVPQRLLDLARKVSIPMEHLFIYISSDSDIAIANITKALSPIPVKHSSVYYRGHSEVIAIKHTGIRQAIIDMFLVADSRALLTTSSSAFSRAISWMRTSYFEEHIEAPYFFLNNKT